MKLKRKVIPIITASLLLAVSSGNAQARACLNTDIVDARISQLQFGMIYDQGAAILFYDSVAGTVYTDRLGFSVSPYTWFSPNKSLFVTFRSRYLFEKFCSGALDAPGTDQMPNAYDPSVERGWRGNHSPRRTIYTGISVCLPLGGKIPPAPAPATSITTFFTSGVIFNYTGIVEDTFFFRTQNGVETFCVIHSYLATPCISRVTISSTP